jgi:hypothetical protein
MRKLRVNTRGKRVDLLLGILFEVVTDGREPGQRMDSELFAATRSK